MKYVKQEDVLEKLKTFSPNLAVTKGEFKIEVPGILEDMEWNHMDQMHRPFIHKTYEEAVRLVVGDNFAISLTRWGKLPIFITVSDVRLKPGLFYQCMTIAGLIYVHFIIALEEKDRIVTANLEWYITSHKFFKFLHKTLSKKLFNLNTRLQNEDSEIRSQRYALRDKGYTFRKDELNYYTSNKLTNNTLYPDLTENLIDVKDLVENVLTAKSLGHMGFLIKKINNNYLIWPEACPHEGEELMKGKLCDKNKIQCPWHGLRFSAVTLSEANHEGQGFGFSFHLKNDLIRVEKISQTKCNPIKLEEESMLT